MGILGNTDLKHKIKLTILLIILLAVMTAIFLFSSQPADASQELSDGLLEKLEEFLNFFPWFMKNAGNKIRKLAHFVEYASLGLVSYFFFGELFFLKEKRLLRAPVFSAVFCFLYACSDEIHQIFVPGRSCELRDILIDSAGTLIGILTAFLFAHLLNRKAGSSDHEDTSP